MGRIALSVLVLFMMVQDGLTTICLPCDPHQVCPLLPDDDDCFPTREVCGCCDVCAGKEGERCTTYTKRCHPDLVCRNDKGVEKRVMEWFGKFFLGKCSEPEYYDEFSDEYYDDERSGEYYDDERSDEYYDDEFSDENYDDEFYDDEYYDDEDYNYKKRYQI